MDDFKKIGIKKSNKEETKEEKADKVMDWRWGPEEKKTVLGLLRGRKMKKELEEKEAKNVCMFNMKMKEEDNKIQIFINKKEMLYSHQNMARAINSFLPYLTNDDLTELGQDILDLMSHREKKEAESKLEVEKHSWPYPDTKKQI